MTLELHVGFIPRALVQESEEPRSGLGLSTQFSITVHDWYSLDISLDQNFHLVVLGPRTFYLRFPQYDGPGPFLNPNADFSVASSEPDVAEVDVPQAACSSPTTTTSIASTASASARLAK
jgi:hypothetical protein